MSLVTCLRPGMVVVDVGACVGGLSEQYRQTGADVWAIEPDPRCWPTLNEHLSNGRLLGMAVGDQEGALTLYRSRQPAHNSLAKANVLEPDDLTPLHVPLSTLDALQANGSLPPHIDAVKVDTQGAEYRILRGAEQLCRTQHPIWWVEFWPFGLMHAGSSIGELCELFAAYGYHPDGQTWAQVESRAILWEGHSATDLLLMTEQGVTL